MSAAGLRSASIFDDQIDQLITFTSVCLKMSFIITDITSGEDTST